MDTSQIRFHWATMGTPNQTCLNSFPTEHKGTRREYNGKKKQVLKNEENTSDGVRGCKLGGNGLMNFFLKPRGNLQPEREP